MTTNLHILLWFQNWRTGAVEQLWLALSSLGGSYFLWAAVAAAFWLLGPRTGWRAAFSLGLSQAAGAFFKPLFAVQRPWLGSKRLQPVPAAMAEAAASFSFPSGHAANALAAAGGIASGIRRRAPWFAVAAFAAAVGVSRLGLGVHFPADVLGGWFLGLLCVGAVHLLLYWADRRSPARDWLLAAIVFLLFLPAFGLGLYLALAHPETDVLGEIAAAWSMLLAVALCRAAERTWVRYDPARLSLPYRLAAFLLGEIFLFLLCAHGQPLFAALAGRSWGPALHLAAIPLWIFVAWPLLLTPLQDPAAP